jgi:hemoglobin-like flavoprotein
MTPAQIAAVEDTFAGLDLEALSADFYRMAFAADPSLLPMFVSDPGAQRDRFAAELEEIVDSIRTLDEFGPRVRTLGARHRGYGVRAAHYKVMGEALMASLRQAIGEQWTPEVEDAWRLAYNLVAETMMLGALNEPRTSDSR